MAIALDEISTEQLVALFNREDHKVADAVATVLPEIVLAVDEIVSRVQDGGRMFYIGSGSGGKIGMLDATECPPTFGVSDDTVIAILSGGSEAATGWREETEDDENLAVVDLQERSFCGKDILIAITASGTTPYALSGLRYARKFGALSIGICCNRQHGLKNLADILILADVGDEVILGSTRLKAGTAQKMILNMLSSCTMIRLGKTYRNFMIEVKPINRKLKERLVDIVKIAANVGAFEARQALVDAGGDAKAAVLMLQKGISIEEAQQRLKIYKGFLAKALRSDLD